MANSDSLLITHPAIASEWHPTLNGELTPDKITQGSGQKVWWLGNKCQHAWDVKVCIRTGQGQGCPICTNKRILIGFNDLETTHPHLASEWHPEHNKDISVNAIHAGSDKKVWWLGKCSHEWNSTVRNRGKSNANCPYCAGQKILIGFNDLPTSHPELVKLIHPTKNENIEPFSLHAGSKKKIHWICEKSHEWSSPVSWQTVKEGLYCSLCNGRNLEVGINDFETMNPELAKEWHPTLNGDLLPSHMRTASHKKVWWLGKCGHEWESAIKNRAGKAKTGCPICLNQIILAGFNDLATTHSSIAIEWHPTKNSGLSVTNISAGSNRKVWWICAKKNHEWKVRPADRVGYQSGCPDCAATNYVSKGEQAIADYLKSLGLAVEQTNRKLLNGTELDIVIPAKKLAIEYNGLYYHTEDMGKGRNYHYDKWVKARDAGYQLLQIWEDEWLSNPERIKNILRHKLGLSDNVKRVFARRTSIVLMSTADAKAFFEANHIQGFASGSYYFGLADASGEILSAMILKKEPRDALNIIRYATSAVVVGGFTKILKYVENNVPVKSFLTFSDHCISDGGLYENNGFVADKEVRPDYRYVVGLERRHKFGYRLKRFRNDPELLWEDGLTERELAKLNNLPRIWDAGKTRWVRHVG